MEILKITGKIELKTGLHIGAGGSEMHIGGSDSPVVKNPLSLKPYIPGSSIKGKMRAMLEWHYGLVAESRGKPTSLKLLQKVSDDKKENTKSILKLFGMSAEDSSDNEIGPARLSFWDLNLTEASDKQIREKLFAYTEDKYENNINRITAKAMPRNQERVPAGAEFDFVLSLSVLEGDKKEELMSIIAKGLKLIELTGIGGSVSRGYGKLEFKDLSHDLGKIKEEAL